MTAPTRPLRLTKSVADALDRGEAEALLLAEEIRADLLITDDAPARAEATRRGLGVVGTVGVLTQARDQGLGPAVTVGLRQGELLGLKWADLDLDAGRLQVRRSIARLNGQGWIEQEPKSARSRRSVALTPLAVESLRRHRRRQLERRVKAVAWEDNDFVFANEVGRPLTPQNLTQRSFHPLLERAGLPRVRFHDLRHTAATLLLAEGVHPKVVQEMLLA